VLTLKSLIFLGGKWFMLNKKNFFVAILFLGMVFNLKPISEENVKIASGVSGLSGGVVTALLSYGRLSYLGCSRNTKYLMSGAVGIGTAVIVSYLAYKLLISRTPQVRYLAIAKIVSKMKNDPLLIKIGVDKREIVEYVENKWLGWNCWESAKGHLLGYRSILTEASADIEQIVDELSEEGNKSNLCESCLALKNMINGYLKVIKENIVFVSQMDDYLQALIIADRAQDDYLFSKINSDAKDIIAYVDTKWRTSWHLVSAKDDLSKIWDDLVIALRKVDKVVDGLRDGNDVFCILEKVINLKTILQDHILFVENCISIITQDKRYHDQCRSYEGMQQFYEEMRQKERERKERIIQQERERTLNARISWLEQKLNQQEIKKFYNHDLNYNANLIFG